MQVADSLENLQRIRALGVHLSLDDFGTGYSSLSFLRELPVDAIKIDRSFVSGLGTNPRDTSIVQGVIAMADALGYAVVAEGIETEAQAETLRQIGCRYAQGFLWSRPAPADAIRAVSRDRTSKRRLFRRRTGTASTIRTAWHPRDKRLRAPARSAAAPSPTGSAARRRRRPRAPSVAPRSGESSSRSTAASNSA